jgi:DNA-binding Lrp family transcriptional regulator
MLNRMLELLREGGTRRIRNLAVELDTTPELVEAMLEDLARMGYLRRVGAECSEECTPCPLAGTCVVGGHSYEESNGQGLAAWVFVEKTDAK